MSRLSAISMCAIDQEPMPPLNPPPTESEWKIYNGLKEDSAKAEAEGRQIIWDLPSEV